LESICEAERNSLKIVGERRKVCEVSLEILDFWSMIQCYTGWLLAYFVGTEGITLAMFLPESVIFESRLTMQHFRCKSIIESYMFTSR